MNIQAINRGNVNTYFTANKAKSGYENPINRKTEKGLTIWGSVGTGAVIGATAAGISTCFIKETAKYRYGKAGLIGLAVMAATMALTLPAKLYNTKVRAFTREKEMDVYIKGNKVEKELYNQMNEAAKNADAAQKKHLALQYAKLKSAKNIVPDFVQLKASALSEKH